MYLSELKKQGYKGSCDCNLEISLYEYGLIHKKTENGYKFIHGVDSNGGEYVTFDHAEMTEEEFKELIAPGGWFETNSVLSYIGHTLEEWLKMPMPNRVSDCISYYGYINIFGESSGFEITSSEHPHQSPV